MPNRLAVATSPYLLQHADNPIDWWEWSPEAFAEAVRRDVPVLLSVGYAACHWCHVMAHESFEDPATAEQVNAGFVAIKVDREERPDIDAVYMAATQAMTGQGGWPMTCFLTPVGEPFHCGTYYPPTPRHGLPGFRQLLAAVTTAWTEDGERVRSSAGEIAARLADGAGASLPPAPVDTDALDTAAATLADDVDERFGGFGGAPKFPPSTVLEFLVRHHERTGSPAALGYAVLTAERMARGGLYDQLAGGFARYSVDAQWVVPHFEKMLYDNALLLRVYAHLARLPGADPLFERVARETAAFLLTDLRTPEGGFAAALDADTDGVEGLTYAWTPAQLREVLGDDDGAWAAALLTVTDEGTFEHGSSTLQLLAEPDDPQRWARVRAALLDARRERPQPARDDKVVTAWNGMAIQALAEAGAALEQPEWVGAAGAAADLLLSLHVVDGRLRRSSRAGAVGTAAGVLEDHAYLADALLALHQATGEAHRLDAATALLDRTLEHFAGDEPGAFFDTADDAEELLHRPRELTDNASPCGSSALASALVTASVLAADGGRFRDAAEAALRSVGTLATRFPRFAGHWLTVAEAVVRGPLQVAVAGPDGDPVRAALLTRARRASAGGTVVVAGEPDAPGVPLLADRPLVGGAAAAYVCRGFVCDRPVGTVEELAELLRA
ncbi:thioredoxin domain-containing protein [Pseudonocardia broussonetiae]|uniref:Thioredoxin domain-containing protein n=1 Tax=Pseudonocardia broussonetiae TaxID=2736640 RepID=A0A6M6JBT7_9PSEU|nr:thioredoxin domain-containing protein [Pseudonocardia broussonetiae]QJY45016.1 thioredoxin domain-containing protein [Pseudonocardia broussonetiae]